MREYLNSNFVNFFDDQAEESYFNDLSDMSVIHESLENKIKNGDLTFDKAFLNEDLSMFCIVNQYTGHIVSIIFFMNEGLKGIDVMVTFVQTQVKQNGYDYIYNIGYHVKQNLRGNGIGFNIVKKSVDEIKEFFKKYGGNLNFDADPDDRYLIEAIVEKTNTASNAIASKLVNSGNQVTECTEHFSQKESFVYSLDLFKE